MKNLSKQFERLHDFLYNTDKISSILANACGIAAMVIGRVNNNVTSQIQRNLSHLIAGKIEAAAKQLTSGLRIQQASDDAAGLVNVNRLQAQIEGLNAAVIHSQSGINVSTIADRGLESITGNLQRIRELVIQAGNNLNGQDGLSAIQAEINQNRGEINRVANSTQFTSNSLLNSGFSAVDSSVTSSEAKPDNPEAAEQSSIQTGANPGQSLLLNFGDVRPQSLGLGAGQTVNDINVTQPGGVSFAIQIVDAAIGQVCGIRAEIGAGVNRLTSTINSLSVTSENLLSSQSLIRDADIAKTAAKPTSNNLLLNVNLNLLIQANQINRDSVLGALS